MAKSLTESENTLPTVEMMMMEIIMSG